MSKELTPAAKAKIMASENPDYITPKQQAFIHAYIANGGNGTQAAITAGYSTKSAAVQAHDLLKMEKIQKRLQPKKDEQIERLALDADWIVTRLMKEADEAPSDAARIRALELLGKQQGIFAPDKKELSINQGGDFLANLDLSDDDLDGGETMQ